MFTQIKLPKPLIYSPQMIDISVKSNFLKGSEFNRSEWLVLGRFFYFKSEQGAKVMKAAGFVHNSISTIKMIFEPRNDNYFKNEMSFKHNPHMLASR